MPKTVQKPMLFPSGGLVEGYAFAMQPPGTTPSCLNVIGYDPKTDRLRGGSRSGSSKYCPDQINGDAAVQNINHVVQLLAWSPNLNEDGSPILEEDGSTSLQEESALIDAGERMIVVVGVAGGTAKVLTRDGTTDITNGALALSQTRQVIQSVPFQGNLYFADGESAKYYDSDTNTLLDWMATAGTLPIDDDGNRPTIITLWAGRILQAGLKSSPRTIFASAVENPFDNDYSPVVINAQQAFATNTPDSSTANNPDIITAMLAYSDDTLIIGGDTTIHILRGNPVEGGRIDLISSITGIAFGAAWCKSPEGFVYFFGSRGGVYRMSAGGGEPQRLTALTLDDRLSRIDHSKNAIAMVWDDQHKGVRLFVTPNAGSGLSASDAMQYFFDVRKEAWWPLDFHNTNHAPRAVHLFDGPDPFDRVVLFGGQDGYVRQIDRDSSDDDGVSINSFVVLGPFTATLLMELQVTLSQGSGNVNWTMIEADELEEALGESPSSAGSFVAGRNRSQWPRTYLNAGYLRLSSSESWALERMVVTLQEASATRARIF